MFSVFFVQSIVQILKVLCSVLVNRMGVGPFSAERTFSVNCLWLQIHCFTILIVLFLKFKRNLFTRFLLPEVPGPRHRVRVLRS